MYAVSPRGGYASQTAPCFHGVAMLRPERQHTAAPVRIGPDRFNVWTELSVLLYTRNKGVVPGLANVRLTSARIFDSRPRCSCSSQPRDGSSR